MDLNKKNNYYELVVIVKPEVGEAKEKEVITKVEEVIKKFEGNIERFDPWGKKRLAHPIKKEVKGIYFYWLYKALPTVIFEVERNLRMNENVLRFLSIKLSSKEFEKIISFETNTSDPQDSKEQDTVIDNQYM